MNAVPEANPDLKLLNAQVAWACGQFIENGQKSMAEAVEWICSQIYLDNEHTAPIVDALLRLVRLHTDEQQAAEKALIQFMQRTYRADSPKWQVRELPGRTVDWTETYCRTLTKPPTRFVNRVVKPSPDIDLMGALLFQAQQWYRMLQYSNHPKHKLRADNLKEAITEFKRRTRNTHLRIHPLTRALLSRLRQHDSDAAEDIAAVFNAQHRPPSSVEVSAAIEKVVEEHETGTKAEKIELLPGLLEFSVRTAILQTAATSNDWTLDTLNPGGDTILYHKNGILTLRIGKPSADSNSKEFLGDDPFTSIRKKAGLAKSVEPSDSQPDLSLTFERSDNGASVTALGDMKRNASEINKGANLMRDGLRTAVYYMVAYASATGALEIIYTPKETETPLGTGRLRPTFTLFFWQGVDDEKVHEAFDSGPGSEPSILAFDIRQHFGLDSLSTTDNSNSRWEAPLVKKWLESLTEQAIDILFREENKELAV